MRTFSVYLKMIFFVISVFVCHFGGTETIISKGIQTNNNYEVLSSGLKIISPESGTKVLAQTNQEIVWEGINANDTVEVFASYDIGKSYQNIGLDCTGLSTVWKVPKDTFNCCILKIERVKNLKPEIIDLYKNNYCPLTMPISWHPDGTKFMSGKYIWDSRTLTIIDSFKLDDGVNTWSPKGNFIITYDDPFFKVYDAKTMKLLSSFIYSNANYSWSHDETKIACEFTKCGIESCTGYLLIIDPKTGKEIKQIQTMSIGVYGVQWSPDDSKLAAVIRKDISLSVINIYNTENYNLIQSYDSTFILLNQKNFSWSPNGSYITYSGYKKNERGTINCLYIWDLQYNIHNYIIHNDNEVFSLSWSPDSKYLATYAGSLKYELLKIWDVNSTKLVNTVGYDNKEKYTRSIAWSPDNDRIACLTNSLVIYNFKRYDILETALTDPCIKIIKPEPLQSKNFDFRYQLINSVKDTVIYAAITNNSIYPIEITDIFLTGEDYEQFNIIDNLPQFIIKPNSYSDIKISFKPNSIGLKKAIIIVNTLYQHYSIELSGIGVDSTTNYTDENEYEKLTEKISAYPNPTTGKTTLKINFSHNAISKVQLFDLLGNQVDDLTLCYKNVNRNEITLDLSDYSSGNYFLVITDSLGNKKTFLNLIKY